MTNWEAMDKIFNCLINCQLSTYTTPFSPPEVVVTISNILALIPGLTKYRARKAIKALISDGVICYKSQGCPAIVNEELVCEAGPPINGYTLTEEGYRTEKWKNAYNAWCKSMEEWAKDSERGICHNCKHLKRHNGELAEFVCDIKGAVVEDPRIRECDEMWERRRP